MRKQAVKNPGNTRPTTRSAAKQRLAVEDDNQSSNIPVGGHQSQARARGRQKKKVQQETSSRPKANARKGKTRKKPVQTASSPQSITQAHEHENGNEENIILNTEDPQSMTSPLLSWINALNSKDWEPVVVDQEADTSYINEYLHEAAPQPIWGTSLESALEIPSSPEDIKPDISGLSNLRPPPRSHNLSKAATSKEKMTVLKAMASILATQLTEDLDVNQIINIANRTFAFLDSIGVYYMPLYKAVYALISYNCDKKAVEMGRKCPAYVIRAQHCELMTQMRDAAKSHSRATDHVKDAQDKVGALRARVEEIKEELRKVDKELAEGEAELAAAEAEKRRHAVVYYEAETQAFGMSDRVIEAEKVIDGLEKRWDAAVIGLERMRTEFLQLQKLLRSEL